MKNTSTERLTRLTRIKEDLALVLTKLSALAEHPEYASDEIKILQGRTRMLLQMTDHIIKGAPDAHDG